MLGRSTKIARVGDKHDCPIHGPSFIVEGSASQIDGRGIARFDDKCSCGCTIVEVSHSMTVDGRGVAYLGSKTSSGGIIVACRGSATLT